MGSRNGYMKSTSARSNNTILSLDRRSVLTLNEDPCPHLISIRFKSQVTPCMLINAMNACKWIVLNWEQVYC